MDIKIENEIIQLLEKNNTTLANSLRERLRLEKIQISANLHLCGVIEMVNRVGKIMEDNKEELSNVIAQIATGSKAKASNKLDFYLRLLFSNKETGKNIATSSSKALTDIYRTIEGCEYFDIDHSGTFHDSNSLNCLKIDLGGNKDQLLELFISKKLLTTLMKTQLEQSLEIVSSKKARTKI